MCGTLAVLEEVATDVPSKAIVLVSEHPNGRDAIKFELSVQVTWTYETTEIA